MFLSLSIFFWQCWENCGLLQDNPTVWSRICSQPSVCVSDFLFLFWASFFVTWAVLDAESLCSGKLSFTTNANEVEGRPDSRKRAANKYKLSPSTSSAARSTALHPKGEEEGNGVSKSRRTPPVRTALNRVGWTRLHNWPPVPERLRFRPSGPAATDDLNKTRWWIITIKKTMPK